MSGEIMTETLEAYEAAIDEKWLEAYGKLAEILKTSLPAGFELKMQYGFPTYVVPLTTYPAGYLERKTEPLPFISLGVNKKYISLYHMGIMGNKKLLTWFQEEYQKQVPTKLNMGKSCIRFSHPQKIPYELIQELVSQMTVAEWITQYEHYMKQKKK